MKEELSKILRPNIYNYLTQVMVLLTKMRKTCRSLQKFLIKQELIFKDCKKCLEKNKTILKIQQRFRNEGHSVFTDCSKCKRLQVITDIWSSDFLFIWCWCWRFCCAELIKFLRMRNWIQQYSSCFDRHSFCC